VCEAVLLTSSFFPICDRYLPTTKYLDLTAVEPRSQETNTPRISQRQRQKNLIVCSATRLVLNHDIRIPVCQDAILWIDTIPCAKSLVGEFFLYKYDAENGLAAVMSLLLSLRHFMHNDSSVSCTSQQSGVYRY
jgi:hypothetical protein